MLGLAPGTVKDIEAGKMRPTKGQKMLIERNASILVTAWDLPSSGVDTPSGPEPAPAEQVSAESDDNGAPVEPAIDPISLLLEWRETNGYSQQDADGALELAPGTVKDIEAGNATLTLGLKQLIARNSGIPVEAWNEPASGSPATSGAAASTVAIGHYLDRCVRGDRDRAEEAARVDWDDLLGMGYSPDQIVGLAERLPSECTYISFRIAVLAAREPAANLPEQSRYDERKTYDSTPSQFRGVSKASLIVDRVGYGVGGGILIGSGIAAIITSIGVGSVLSSTDDTTGEFGVSLWTPQTKAGVGVTAVVGGVSIIAGIVLAGHSGAIGEELDQRSRAGIVVGPGEVSFRF